MQGSVELEVLRSVVKQLTLTFNEFISACMDADNNPVAPTKQALYKARGCLPIWCENTMIKEKKLK